MLSIFEQKKIQLGNKHHSVENETRLCSTA